MIAPADLALRLGLDVVALAALVWGIYLPRHRRTDLAVVHAMFNVGLFLALIVIAGGQVSIGVGFGLFAVLSIVRLRSEPFSNRELAYFFVALVLGLVCAIDLGSAAYAGALATVALLAAWLIDHGDALARSAPGRAAAPGAAHGRAQPHRAARGAGPQLPQLAGARPADLAEPGGEGQLRGRAALPARVAEAPHRVDRPECRTALRDTASFRNVPRFCLCSPASGVAGQRV